VVGTVSQVEALHVKVRQVFAEEVSLSVRCCSIGPSNLPKEAPANLLLPP
jgi:hypothetical protein